MTDVWECGVHAANGGAVMFLAATEAVALEWLEAERSAQASYATRANGRFDRLTKWPVPQTIVSEADRHWFGTLNDTYYARRRLVCHEVPEQLRGGGAATDVPENHSPTPNPQ